MLLARIRTSLLIQPIIFVLTIALFTFAGAMAMVLVTMEPTEIISEGVGISDSIKARLNP